jgi:uncharacterized membrane protein YeaQ/YmgE (transglycosylase-associated protein family)
MKKNVLSDGELNLVGITINWKDLLIAGLVFVLFFGVYFTISRQMIQQTPIAKYDDVLFEIDSARAIIDMTVFSGYHYRTEVHPIYVLLVNPLAEIIGRIISPDEITAIFINSLLGAMGTALAFVLFRLLHTKWLSALLLAFLFGFSASQLFLSVIPDTASLAVCTLLVTYVLFAYSLEYTTISETIWIAAGILTLGVTTTNFMQTLICYGVIQLKMMPKQSFTLSFWKMTRFTFAVISITALLALLQKAIYPSSTLFFLPEVYIGELSYASASIFDEPMRIGGIILKSFFSDTITAPMPIYQEMPKRIIPAVTFTAATSYTPIGYIGLILWTVLAGLSIVHAIKYKKYDPFLLGAAACLFFNLVLHSFYGIGEKNRIELFLYTGNLTFLVIALASRWAQRTSVAAWVLIPLVATVAANNIIILQQIITTLAVFR